MVVVGFSLQIWVAVTSEVAEQYSGEQEKINYNRHWISAMGNNTQFYQQAGLNRMSFHQPNINSVSFVHIVIC